MTTRNDFITALAHAKGSVVFVADEDLTQGASIWNSRELDSFIFACHQSRKLYHCKRIVALDFGDPPPHGCAITAAATCCAYTKTGVVLGYIHLPPPPEALVMHWRAQGCTVVFDSDDPWGIKADFASLVQEAENRG